MKTQNKAANQRETLTKRLETQARKIIGGDLIRVFVFIGFGWNVYTKSEASAQEILALSKQLPADVLDKAFIEQHWDEEDILDDEGVLVDIKIKPAGWKVCVKLKKKA